MLLTFQAEDGSMKKLRIKPASLSPVVTIGRGKDATIAIGDEKSSRINTAIRYWDDMFIIRDMGSRNGTFLNGEKIEVTRLSAGDVIKIGDTEIHTSAEGVSQGEATMMGSSH